MLLYFLKKKLILLYTYEHSHNSEPIQENVTHQKKKKKPTKEHPHPIIWKSHSIVSKWNDTSTIGACRGWSQVGCNATAMEHMPAWWKTQQLIFINKAMQTNTTLLRVIRNMRPIVKHNHRNLRVNSNPNKSIMVCHVEHPHNEHKNTSHDN